MILETLILMGKRKQGFMVLKEIAEQLGSEKWLSTQTTAYALIAIAKYAGKAGTKKEMKYTYHIDQQGDKTITTTDPVSQVQIPFNNTNSKKISVTNNGNDIIFVRIILEGVPITGDVTDAENELKMKVNYRLSNGKLIDPAKIEQGTDFIAEVIVENPGLRGNYEQMALTQIFPSGWEIINNRMNEIDNLKGSSLPTYQDIRDDRVYTYFNINRREKKVFRIQLNATYLGRYYLPTTYTEAMYEATINARRHGKWIEVMTPGL